MFKYILLPQNAYAREEQKLTAHHITKYFRDSVAADLKINFKNILFTITDLNSIYKGKLKKEDFQTLSDRQGDKLNIIIIAKTIKTIFNGQQKVDVNQEEMSGILYIPAILSSNGVLYPSEDKYPWIPREHLYPIIDQDLAVGHLDEFNEFMSNNFQRLKRNLNWNNYVGFAKDMYETVTDTEFTSLSVKGIELEQNVYVIKDNVINATGHILKLYDHLLANQTNHLPLYNRFIKPQAETITPLTPNGLSEMKMHVGQMGGEYPLSPSQRECLNHFNHMEEGDILAVNGPPGTGKTTLLQSLVANLYVQRALKKTEPPLIVASSTNNQAVTNIIESFGQIKPIWQTTNLECRWIEGVSSFAVYFPSVTKEKEAKEKGFQYTNSKGENFFDEVESEENVERSTKKMIDECNRYFGTHHTNIEQCERSIWNRLSTIEKIRQKLLLIFQEYERIAPQKGSIDTYHNYLLDEKRKAEESFQTIQARIEEWTVHFSKIPLVGRWFSFLPFIKRKIQSHVRYFIGQNESFLNESMSIDDIVSIYSVKAQETRVKMQQIDSIYQSISKLNQRYNNMINSLDEMQISVHEHKTVHSLDNMNERLDISIKYASFWLAIHYFECRWLREKRLTEKQKGKNFENVLKQFHLNMSMLAPCFVMTFYQLPKFSLAYDNGKEHFMYNEIDLLIVDEAGQVTPEIAACSFSLAKRAVVVGDVHQIEPVWNINQSLDVSLALSNCVIETIEDFDRLRELGLNTSESSVMRVACKSSKYEKYKERGLFLSEHRRCYDEIIDYCNKLVYKGNLEPMRGKASNDKKNRINRLLILPFGHIQVDSNHSSKKAGSRYNKVEAEAIAGWINRNFNDICNAYKGENQESLIGIITPFKMQVGIIKRALSPAVKKYVDVGTVHTFQGGERKIIIMSTVYGKKDGCFFIDANKSLLNVAVSRAKDSFIIMGDINCLSDSVSKPSGLLKKMLLEYNIVYA